jgi:hypothetical protein
MEKFGMLNLRHLRVTVASIDQVVMVGLPPTDLIASENTAGLTTMPSNVIGEVGASEVLTSEVVTSVLRTSVLLTSEVLTLLLGTSEVVTFKGCSDAGAKSFDSGISTPIPFPRAI